MTEKAKEFRALKDEKERLDAALKEAAFRLGTFVLDGEEVWYDMVGGEHRTGAQAQTANDQLGHPRLAPRPRG